MLIGFPTRSPGSAGERAEWAVWKYLDDNCPSEWIILCSIPKREWQIGRQRIFITEIDCVIIALKLIFVVGIKSHGGNVRVYADRPWTVDGNVIDQTSNAHSGIWKNHEEHCFRLKKVLRRFEIISRQVIPKVIIEARDVAIEFGHSGLGRQVVSKEGFLRDAIRKDSSSPCNRISSDTAAEITNILKDGDWSEKIPARAEGAATEERLLPLGSPKSPLSDAAQEQNALSCDEELVPAQVPSQSVDAGDSRSQQQEGESRQFSDLKNCPDIAAEPLPGLPELEERVRPDAVSLPPSAFYPGRDGLGLPILTKPDVLQVRASGASVRDAPRMVGHSIFSLARDTEVKGVWVTGQRLPWLRVECSGGYGYCVPSQLEQGLVRSKSLWKEFGRHYSVLPSKSFDIDEYFSKKEHALANEIFYPGYDDLGLVVFPDRFFQSLTLKEGVTPDIKDAPRFSANIISKLPNKKYYVAGWVTGGNLPWVKVKCGNTYGYVSALAFSSGIHEAKKVRMQYSRNSDFRGGKRIRNGVIRTETRIEKILGSVDMATAMILLLPEFALGLVVYIIMSLVKVIRKLRT